MLHHITKPTPWRGGEEHAEDEARIEVKFKEWHAHWQVGLNSKNETGRGKA